MAGHSHEKVTKTLTEELLPNWVKRHDAISHLVLEDAEVLDLTPSITTTTKIASIIACTRLECQSKGQKGKVSHSGLLINAMHFLNNTRGFGFELIETFPTQPCLPSAQRRLA